MMKADWTNPTTWLRSEKMRAIVESVEQEHADEREALVMAFRDRQQVAAEIAERNRPRIEASAAMTRETLNAHEAAKLSEQRIRHESTAEQTAAAMQVGRLENKLRDMLPEYAADALARLNAEEDRLMEESSRLVRSIPQPPTEWGAENRTKDYRDEIAAFTTRLRLLKGVRCEYGADLHVLPVDEIAARVRRIEAVLAMGDEVTA